jgi:disulfide bond formation protein DsbB
MFILPNKTLFLLIFLACIGLLASAYYFEYVMYLDPCPLCMMQRIAVLLVGLVGLSGFILSGNRVKQIIHSGLLMLSSVFGMFLAGRHIWIQNLPADQVPTCGPSLEYMVDTLPWAEVISIMLQGNGNCADLQWSFLGLSMPEWVMVWFIGFMLAGVYALLQCVKQNPK